MTVHGVPSPTHDRVTSWQRDQALGLDLCSRHAEALARLASLILGDDDAADEVVSDTIAAVCHSADESDTRGVTRVHLARSVYHRCLGRLATYERFAVAAQHAGTGDARDLRVPVPTLTAIQRAVVALVLFGDHDVAQAATTLNLSPATVGGHLRDTLLKIHT